MKQCKCGADLPTPFDEYGDNLAEPLCWDCWHEWSITPSEDYEDDIDWQRGEVATLEADVKKSRKVIFGLLLRRLKVRRLILEVTGSSNYLLADELDDLEWNIRDEMSAFRETELELDFEWGELDDMMKNQERAMPGFVRATAEQAKHHWV